MSAWVLVSPSKPQANNIFPPFWSGLDFGLSCALQMNGFSVVGIRKLPPFTSILSRSLRKEPFELFILIVELQKKSEVFCFFQSS